jgi:hypothetical protein
VEYGAVECGGLPRVWATMSRYQGVLGLRALRYCICLLKE